VTALAPGALAATWHGRPPEALDHVVVLAPHPDDEVLACAALMTWLHDQGHHLSIIAVTDGEGSHARSRRVDPDELRARRAAERTAALARLGLDLDVERLALPDGAVGTHEARLQRALEERLGPHTTVVAPWRRDGHPDHEATGRAALVAARRTGAQLWEVPIWAKVAGPPPLSVRPGSRLLLSDDQRRRKREAVACFASQLVPQGPDPVDGPVVHPHELDAMLDGHEDLLWR
jgi:LmbE family N-acetylglucosaminyl deacetylase